VIHQREVTKNDFKCTRSNGGGGERSKGQNEPKENLTITKRSEAREKRVRTEKSRGSGNIHAMF